MRETRDQLAGGRLEALGRRGGNVPGGLRSGLALPGIRGADQPAGWLPFAHPSAVVPVRNPEAQAIRREVQANGSELAASGDQELLRRDDLIGRAFPGHDEPEHFPASPLGEEQIAAIRLGKGVAVIGHRRRPRTTAVVGHHPQRVGTARLVVPGIAVVAAVDHV